MRLVTQRSLNCNYDCEENYEIAKSCESFTCNYFSKSDVKLPNPNTIFSTMSLDFSPEGDYFLSTHGDHTIKIISFPDGELLKVLVGHQRTPWNAKFNPRNPDYLISGDFTGTVYIWNWRQGKRLWQALCPENEYVFGVEFHPTADYAIITTMYSIYGWDYTHTNQPKPLYTVKPSIVKASKLYANGTKLIMGYNINKSKDKNEKLKVTLKTFDFDIEKESLSNGKDLFHNCIVYSDRTLAITRDSLTLMIVSQTPPSLNQSPIHFYESSLDTKVYENTNEKRKNSKDVKSTIDLAMMKNLFKSKKPESIRTYHNIPSKPLDLSGMSKKAYNTNTARYPSTRYPQYPNVMQNNQEIHSNNRFMDDDPMDGTGNRSFSVDRANRDRNIPERSIPTSHSSSSENSGINNNNEPYLSPLVLNRDPQMIAKQNYSYIYILSLDPLNLGSILEYHPVIDPVEIISFSYSPTEEYVLITNQHTRGGDSTQNVDIPYTRIYRMKDWTITNEIYNREVILNACMWSPTMQGYIYGTDKGKVFIHTYTLNESRKQIVQHI